MNYYEHHLGDWAQATAHLTFLEEAAYLRLVRWYYAEERPLPADERAIFRLVRAASEDEREAVRVVLGEFFQLRDDGYHQPRCDREIERYQQKREKARGSANQRWNSERNANASGSDANASGSNADAMRGPQSSHGIRNALQSPVSSHQTPEEVRTPHTPRKRGDVAERFDPAHVTGLDPHAWAEWVTYRANRKPAIKPASMRKAAELMARLGDGQRAAVDHSIANGYQGLVAPKDSLHGTASRATKLDQDTARLERWARDNGVLDDDASGIRPAVGGVVRIGTAAGVARGDGGPHAVRHQPGDERDPPLGITASPDAA